jgi:hypothetical protein
VFIDTDDESFDAVYKNPCKNIVHNLEILKEVIEIKYMEPNAITWLDNKIKVLRDNAKTGPNKECRQNITKRSDLDDIEIDIPAVQDYVEHLSIRRRALSHFFGKNPFKQQSYAEVKETLEKAIEKSKQELQNEENKLKELKEANTVKAQPKNIQKSWYASAGSSLSNMLSDAWNKTRSTFAFWRWWKQ